VIPQRAVITAKDTKQITERESDRGSALRFIAPPCIFVIFVVEEESDAR